MMKWLWLAILSANCYGSGGWIEGVWAKPTHGGSDWCNQYINPTAWSDSFPNSGTLSF